MTASLALNGHCFQPHSLSRAMRLTAIAMAAQCLLGFAAQAQITASGVAGQTPLLSDKAANGTPIIQIAAPSLGGVSRNQYLQFNVGAKGVILNNITSTGSANSTLAGGQIKGNSQLGTPAQVIVNQVTGGIKSVLAGQIEVAGSAADVVVANPSGIDCPGCGFINTNRATLVTGTPVYNGSKASLIGFNSSSGYLRVTNLDARNAWLRLLSNYMVIDGAVKAGQVNLLAGFGLVDNVYMQSSTPMLTDTSKSSSFIAIVGQYDSEGRPILDPNGVALVGNVQAGSIYIVNNGNYNQGNGFIWSNPNAGYIFAGLHFQPGVLIKAEDELIIQTKTGIHVDNGVVFKTNPFGFVGITDVYVDFDGSSLGGSIYTGDLNVAIDRKSRTKFGVTEVFGAKLNVDSFYYNILASSVRFQGTDWTIAGEAVINAQPGAFLSKTTGKPNGEANFQISPNAKIGGNFSVNASAISFVQSNVKTLSTLNVGGDLNLLATAGATFRCTTDCANPLYSGGPDIKMDVKGALNIAAKDVVINPNVQINAGSFNVNATQSINVNRATITSNGDAAFIAGTGITTDNAQIAATTGNLTVVSETAMNLQRTNLSAGKDLFIATNPYLPFSPVQAAPNIMTGGTLQAKGDITVVTRDNLGFGAAKISLTEAISGGTMTTDTYDTTAINADGNVVLQSSRGIVNLDGTSISADGSVVVSGMGIGLFGPVNTKKTLTDQGGTNTIISDQTLVVGKIEAQGDVSLLAMALPTDSPTLEFKGAGDIFITGAEVTSIDGHVALTAARDLDVVNDVTVDTFYETYYRKKKRLFNTTITQRVTSTVDQTIEQSRVAGNTVSMAAGNDLTVAASDIQATGSIGMHADNNLELLSTAEMDSSYDYSRVTKKGIFSSGPWSLSIGVKTVTDTRTEVNELQTGATVSSTLGDINLSAGNQLTQMSSEVLAPAGSIRMAAKEVIVSTNNNTNSLLNTLQIKQIGYTLSASHPLVTAYNTVKDMERARKRTSSGHTQAMAMMVSALTLESAFKDLPDLTSFNEVSNYLAPNRWSLSVTLGTSVYDSRSYSYSTLPVESSIVAGRDVSIVATGDAAQEQGRISIVGSAISAGGALSLQAKDSINLLAAKATQTNESQETSRSASMGMNFSVGKEGVGVSATVAASRMRGFTNGHGIIYYPVALTAGLIDSTGLLNLKAGTDLDIQGATLSGNRVMVNAGRNFTMRSVQDESFYAATKKSWGFNLSVPIPVPGTKPPPASLGLSYSQMKLMADFQSAKEQTAIRAGAGGLEIYVNDQTKLVGAVIASNGEPESDYFSTGTLVMEHLENKENISGEAKALQLNISQDPQKAVSFGGTAYGFAEIDRSTLGHTNAAIAPGVVVSVTDPKKQVAITTGLSSASSRWDASLAQTRQSLITNTDLRAKCASTDTACQSNYDKLIRSNNRNITDFENLRATDISNHYISGIIRDVSAAHQPVAPTFDARQATDDLELGASTMVKFVQTGYKKVGDMAQPEVDKSTALKDKAKLATLAGDQAAAASYNQQAKAIDDLWGDTGTYRLVLHALVGGIAWGAPGALGNAANVYTAVKQKEAVDAAMKAVGLDPESNTVTRDVLLGLSSTVVGAAAGGAQGAAAAFNADANNRKLHLDTFLKLRSSCVGKSNSECTTINRMAGTRSINLTESQTGLANFDVYANLDNDGKFVSYELFSRTRHELGLVMEPLEYFEFLGLSTSVQNSYLNVPQYSLDMSSGLMYAVQQPGSNRALEHMAYVTSDPDYWLDVALGVIPSAGSAMFRYMMEAKTIFKGGVALSNELSLAEKARLISDAPLPVNATRLNVKLAFEEANILTRDGASLTKEAISLSREIPLSGGKITKSTVVKELTSNGSSIDDWGKFTTQTINLSSGQKSQIHFYKNKVTNEVNLNVDFKVKGLIK